MAALKLFLSQARRHHFLFKHPSSFHSPFSLTSHRPLSSSSPLPQDQQDSPNPPQDPPQRRPSFQSVPIQPVSYPLKPKDPAPQQTESSEPQFPRERPPPPPPRRPVSAEGQEESQRGWTREDIRYVKDAPSIEPVSYAPRVAPLPEDKVGDDPGVVTAEERNEEAEKERRMLEVEDEIRKKMEEEKMKVPFPMLIMPKRNETPPVLDLNEAIRQVKVSAKAKFDETVEAHVRLGIDSKRTELAVRGTVILPHGAPKAVSVAVFAEGAEAEEARNAGADIVGGKELIEEIASGSNKLKVDKCFSTPGMAPHLGKIAQYLRKRRLMPDKKLGTLTSDIAGQLKELRQGRVEFKMESKSILHIGVGKVSYKEEALRENIGAFMNAVLLAKPAGLKKTSKYAGYVLSVHLSSTMGPGVPVSIQSLSKAADNYRKVHVV
ncbi:hypothetical protein HN51_026035 [Arachis hypogaea]|uniref:CL1 n=2 Tax=Arachis TaxID=3817 RepID=A0A445CGA6_ARAHY|nr:uncharacterized protein LOC107459199 [Arachis duranensis]XP_025610364.1 uncharacterized protein LOC112703227 [Arachis hypogaea]QHO28556.1 50S ribosomal protein [Arachis hypogaea]RYR49954.1 hypothetical protein Ahy_A07g036480 [Arachis hypogaea]